MQVKEFVENFREAFGPATDLPVAFWFGVEPVAQPEKVNGCLFKAFGRVRAGEPVAFDGDTITCGGGRLYTGYAPMPPHVPAFVSGKEKYKQTPGLVEEYVESVGIPPAGGLFLNFTRVDNLETFDGIEGLVFVAEPDALSGLFTWACFDTNRDDAVTAMFGSGCSAVVTRTVVENRRGGKRTFLGGFDPSVRPFFGEAELTFAVPLSRMREMLATMRDSCLYGTHAWTKLRERMDK